MLPRTTPYHRELSRLDEVRRTIGALRADIRHHLINRDAAALQNAADVAGAYAGRLSDARHPAAELTMHELRGLAWTTRREAEEALVELRSRPAADALHGARPTPTQQVPRPW